MKLRNFWPLAFSVAAFAHSAINHDYDLKNVLWKLSFDTAGHTIAGDVTNTVTLQEATPTVQFHCANLKVATATVGGQPATFKVADDIVTVTLPTSGHNGDTLDVEITYTATPERGFYFVEPIDAFPSKTGMVYTQGEGEDNRDWLPTYDLPDDKATSECYITVPASWKAVSNGALVGVADQGDKKVFHWKMSQPFSTYLISLVAGEYSEGKGTWHNTPVSYFVPPGLESQGEMSFGRTPDMIDLYSKLTGVDYPYPKFSQEVVGDFVEGGMENISAVTQQIRTLHAASSEPIVDSTSLVAHELAHQWFGDLITCQTWEHMWLNEGFATTMPLFLDREWHGQDWFDMDRYQNFEGAIDSIGSRNRKAVAGDAGSVKEVTMGSPYPGGASRILMLMHKMGEPTFWKGINAFLTKYEFKPATTSEFFQVMSEVYGQDLGNYESQWYHTSATPSLTVDVKGDDVVISQLAPYYKLSVPVWFLDKGAWVQKSAYITGATTRLNVGDLAKDPFLVDPECWTLTELSYQNKFTAGDVMELYRHAPNAAGKARVIAALSGILSTPQKVALAREEKVPALVGMFAQRLGAEGQDYLVELTRGSDAILADTAVNAMAGFTPSADTAARLKEIVANNPNETLREHAMRSLLAQSADSGLAERAWNMKAFDDGYRVMALDWWAHHKPDQARTVALKVLSGVDNLPTRLASINALAIVKERPGEHAVYDVLIKLAVTPTFRVRVNAIRALGALGNKDAIPVLKSMSKYAIDPAIGAKNAALDQLQK